MITEKELLNAIRECEADPITGQKRVVLADLYIIYDHLFGRSSDDRPYSFSSNQQSESKTIDISPTSEFLGIINGKNLQKTLDVVDELMEAIRTLHPKMYDRVLDKLSDL